MFDSLSFADKFTLRIDNSADIKFTDHIDDTGTTQTYRFGSRITYDLVGRLHSLFVNGTCFDGSICGTHTTANVTTLKGRTCGTCATHHKIWVSKYKLSVCTKVDKQWKLRSVPDLADHCSGCDIATYIASDIRRHNNMRVFIDINPHIRSK